MKRPAGEASALSDSHWGETSLKWPFVCALGTVTLAAGLIALFAWSPWKEATEVEWLTTYRAWSDGIDASLRAGLVVSRIECEATFDDAVGEPAQAHLRPVGRSARRGCKTLTPLGWRDRKAAIVRALIDAHGSLVPPRLRRDISDIAGSSVGVHPDVYCWQADAWVPLFEQYAIVRGGEEASPEGIADNARNRIDLGPGVCAGLHWYLRRIRPASLSYENFEMAKALTVLTHQAEHLRARSASEAEVECYAVQHVRPLVLAAGWDADYATELALQAWELSYQRLPQAFRSSACRDGGPLDRNPRSSAWP